MKTVTLKRLPQPESHTFGVIYILGYPRFVTLELPWNDNRTDISCIPPGEYECFIEQSPKNGRVYELKDVTNRTDIQIHIGNTLHDTEGCILIGTGFGKLYNDEDYDLHHGISNSTKAFWSFMTEMGEEDFILKIEGEI